MRVKSHQIRAKVAFTKPLTTYLMRGKGDFSCRVKRRLWFHFLSKLFQICLIAATLKPCVLSLLMRLKEDI